MKISLYYTSMFLTVIAYCSCAQTKEDPDKKRIEEANAAIQKNAGMFNPAMQQDPAKLHVGIKVNFDGTNFTPDPSKFTVRQGRLPYLQKSNQPFKVIYKDANDTQIGYYNIEDPTTITS